jgi:hypothetical protein
MCYTLAPILYNKGGRKARISLGQLLVFLLVCCEPLASVKLII